jgi:hypothetical protein
MTLIAAGCIDCNIAVTGTPSRRAGRVGDADRHGGQLLQDRALSNCLSFTRPFAFP